MNIFCLFSGFLRCFESLEMSLKKEKAFPGLEMSLKFVFLLPWSGKVLELKIRIESVANIFQTCLDLHHLCLVFQNFYGGGPRTPRFVLGRFALSWPSGHFPTLNWPSIQKVCSGLLYAYPIPELGISCTAHEYTMPMELHFFLSLTWQNTI